MKAWEWQSIVDTACCLYICGVLRLRYLVQLESKLVMLWSFELGKVAYVVFGERCRKFWWVLMESDLISEGRCVASSWDWMLFIWE